MTELTAPGSDGELHARVRELLTPARWRILEPLIGSHPDALGREDLAAAAGVSSASSGYQNNLGGLRSLSLIDYPRTGAVVATDVLFPNGSSERR